MREGNIGMDLIMTYWTGNGVADDNKVGSQLANGGKKDQSDYRKHPQIYNTTNTK